MAKDQQGVSVLRYVFFANQRAYMLEMHSEYQLESKAKRILESVTSFYLQDYNDMVDKKLLFVVLGSFLFVVLGLACLLIPKLSLRRKGISMPTSEKWLCRYIYVAWLVNVVCVFADIYSVYTGEIKQDGSWWSYFLLFLCAVGMNIYTNAYIINKVKVEHGFDYFVPKWLKAYLVNRHVTDAEYKSVVVFLLYPFFILGNLPLGLCVLCYVLPVSLLSMVLLEFRNFSKWSNGEGEKDSQLKDIEYGTFKDYYLLLDIDRGVSEEEVDKAFNRAMAKYHSGVDSGLYTEAYKRNVQEAYRVLSSVNRLRPEYDKEFDVYRASNKPEYQYSDEKTKKDIMLVQEELYGGIMQKINIKRGKTYNSVVRGIYLFLLLLVIAAIVLSKHTNGRSNDYRNRRSSDYRESLWDKIDVDIPFVDIKM